MKIISDFLVNTSNEGYVDYMFDPSVDVITPRQVTKACFLGQHNCQAIPSISSIVSTINLAELVVDFFCQTLREKLDCRL